MPLKGHRNDDTGEFFLPITTFFPINYTLNAARLNRKLKKTQFCALILHFFFLSLSIKSLANNNCTLQFSLIHYFLASVVVRFFSLFHSQIKSHFPISEAKRKKISREFFVPVEMTSVGEDRKQEKSIVGQSIVPLSFTRS